MKRTILLAEDSENDVLLFRKAIERTGLPVSIQHVQDGEELMEYFQGKGKFSNRTRHPLPFLVLLDLKMPKKDGFDVLAWIRSQSHLKRLPVIIFSSSRQINDVNRAYDLGANSYLTKPSEFAELTEILSIVVQYWSDFSQHPDIETI